MATTKQIGIGVGVAAAAAAAAAGAYWLYGSKDAAKHRTQAKSWMLKARAEVMEGIAKMKNVDKETFLKLVDDVIERYRGVSGVTSAELSKVTKDLKDSWAHIQKAGTSTKKATRKAKRGATKAAKKAQGK